MRCYSHKEWVTHWFETPQGRRPYDVELNVDGSSLIETLGLKATALKSGKIRALDGAVTLRVKPALRHSEWNDTP